MKFYFTEKPDFTVKKSPHDLPFFSVLLLITGFKKTVLGLLYMLQFSSGGKIVRRCWLYFIKSFW